MVLAVTVCGILNWGYGYLLAFLVIPVGYSLKRRRDILLNFLGKPGFWLLAFFGVAYTAMAGVNFTNIQCYILLPLMAYIIGWCSFEQGGRDAGAVRDGILGIAIGLGLHSCLNYAANMGNSRGQLVDFWTGNSWSATGSGFLNTMMFSLLFYTLILEKRRGMKLLMLALTAGCMLYALMLGTRTQLVILAVVLPVAVLFYLREGKSWKTAGKLAAGMGLLVLAAVLCYRLDLFHLRELARASNLAARYGEQQVLNRSDARRGLQLLQGLRGLLEHPLGGRKDLFYYHNMWLDICRVAGLVPMVLMLCYHGLVCVHGVRLFRDRSLDAGTRYGVLCVYLGLLMNCFVEPVLEGLISMFLAFCVINGLTDGLYYHRLEMRYEF